MCIRVGSGAIQTLHCKSHHRFELAFMTDEQAQTSDAQFLKCCIPASKQQRQRSICSATSLKRTQRLHAWEAQCDRRREGHTWDRRPRCERSEQLDSLELDGKTKRNRVARVKDSIEEHE